MTAVIGTLRVPVTYRVTMVVREARSALLQLLGEHHDDAAGAADIGELVYVSVGRNAAQRMATEVHAFDDGNGRVARILANAELSSSGQVRIVIPTSYRNDYLAGLNGVSHRAGQGQALISVLDFAQRWTVSVDWSTYEGAHHQLTDANAYIDPGVAERSGQRLKMPER